MGLTPQTKEMLFILGQFFRETGRRFSSAPLTLSVLKAEFIDIVKASGAVSKQERAIYRNLGSLQKSKHISYKDKSLKLTKKGRSEYIKLAAELERYNYLVEKVRFNDVGFKRKKQTKLKY